MTVSKLTLVCDNCGRKKESKLQKVRDVKLEARTAGWKKTNNLDLCPDCRPRTKQGIFHPHRQSKKGCRLLDPLKITTNL